MGTLLWRIRLTFSWWWETRHMSPEQKEKLARQRIKEHYQILRKCFEDEPESREMIECFKHFEEFIQENCGGD